MPLGCIQVNHSESSADHFHRFRSVCILITLIVLILAPDGFAAPVRGITTPAQQPVIPMTPEGGVLMIPLSADRPGDSWPQTLPLTLEDGRQITGHIAWIAPTPRRHDARWTDSPLGLSVRAIRATDRTGETQVPRGDQAAIGAVRRHAGTPFLLAQLPPASSGSIQFLNQTLQPRWMPADALDLNDDDDHDASDMLRREIALDRPDPDHPLEYWRWILFADRLQLHPPRPPQAEDDVTVTLAALHTALVWQAALDRVREHSRGVADHLRDLLTRVARDDDHGVAFAAWIADPAAVNTLLNGLLDAEIDGEALIDRALRWADRHQRLMVWLESATSEYARVAIVNPSFRPTVARLRWADPDEIPLAVKLPAGALTRVRIERPATDAEPGDRSRTRPMPGVLVEELPSPQVLTIETSDLAAGDEPTRYTLVLDAPTRPVHPPGVHMPPLSPTLTLASVQQGQPPVLPEQYATTGHLRRLQGRWELLIESRRPPAVESHRSTDERAEAIDNPDDGSPTTLPRHMRGREQIAIFIGEDGVEGAADTLLIIPESGDHELLRGRSSDGLRIHRRSFTDRWNCRVELPDAWLNVDVGEAVHLGITRTFDGSGAATSPMPIVPWRLEPGRFSFDLTRWDDVPRD